MLKQKSGSRVQKFFRRVNEIEQKRRKFEKIRSKGWKNLGKKDGKFD